LVEQDLVGTGLGENRTWREFTTIRTEPDKANLWPGPYAAKLVT
jgi:hypothetical protein